MASRQRSDGCRDLQFRPCLGWQPPQMIVRTTKRHDGASSKPSGSPSPSPPPLNAPPTQRVGRWCRRRPRPGRTARSRRGDAAHRCGRGPQALGGPTAVAAHPPKTALRFAATQLRTMPEALRRGLPNASGRMVFTELTGKPLDGVVRDCQTYPLARVFSPRSRSPTSPRWPATGTAAAPGAPTGGRCAPAMTRGGG